ncbi:hypothetical protein NLJ89_g6633 [Agrocybe chaxingu]|uniref:Uncharacterized protein n=1 Tax=Agrocybe chaxingu TaxID=84603 RepID=A0A9W8JYS3_9AGAR|nr:hypothetical protein NLJ89_g6633 [Agrocybe chaxingu]
MSSNTYRCASNPRASAPGPLSRMITRVPINQFSSVTSYPSTVNTAKIPPPNAPITTTFDVNEHYQSRLGARALPANNILEMPKIFGLEDEHFHRIGDPVYVRRVYHDGRASAWMTAIVESPVFERDKRTQNDTGVRLYSVVINDNTAPPRKNGHRRTYCPEKGEIRAVPNNNIRGSKDFWLFPIKPPGSSYHIWTPGTVVDLGDVRGYLVKVCAGKQKGKDFDNIERFLPLQAKSLKYLQEKHEAVDVGAITEMGIDWKQC